MFNVGDEVYVKATVVDTDKDKFKNYNHKVKFADSINCEWDWVSGSSISDKTYTQGLADAWELAKKIYDMTCTQIEKIFDVDGGFWNVVRKITVEEALAKIEAHEKERGIKVGDEVVIDGEYFIVTKVIKGEPNTTIYGLEKDGEVICYSARQFEKTGKHIDIESLLRQIGE